ncbi:MAG: MATE family efflux transporter, partial [Porphyromonadaceae bacterium]|nr:MATE family efflux transporter [Porphyromonadaceae bacterium]
YQVGDGMQITLAGALRGLGIVKPMVWMAFVSYFIISLPFSYFFAFGCNGGAPGVWWGYPIGLSSAALLYFQHFYRKSQPSPKGE